MAVTLKELLDKLNGIRSIGFAELADGGISPSKWFAIPKAFISIPELKEINASKMTAEYIANCAKFKSADDYPSTSRVSTDSITAAVRENILVFKDKGSIAVIEKEITEDQHKVTIVTLLNYYSKLSKEDRIMKTAFNYIALNKGWVQYSTKDEAVLIDNDAKDNADYMDAVVFIHSHAQEIIGLSLAAGISHWLTNHTIGAMNSVNLVQKTWSFTTVKQERNEKGVQLNKMLYDHVHPISKRNVLFSTDRTIIGLTGLYTYGLRIPCEMEIDKSFNLRLGGLPAGNRRLEIAVALTREMLRLGTAICADAFHKIDSLTKLYIQAKKIGISGHIGARYYSFKSDNEAVYNSLCNSDVDEIIRSYGSILLAIDPECTLAQSPIIRSVLNTGHDLLAEMNAKAMLKAFNDSRAAAMKDIMAKMSESIVYDQKEIEEKLKASIIEIDEFNKMLETDLAKGKYAQDRIMPKEVVKEEQKADPIKAGAQEGIKGDEQQEDKDKPA